MTGTQDTALSVTLNGAGLSTRAATVAALLEEQGFTGKVATAVNGTFVPERARRDTHLAPGDCVEVVTARQGG
jgi:sulfur carrier protein